MILSFGAQGPEPPFPRQNPPKPKSTLPHSIGGLGDESAG